MQHFSLFFNEQKKLFLDFRRGFWKFFKCNSIERKVYLKFYLYKTIQYNSLNVKPKNSRLNKLKSVIKNETEAVLRLSSNMICNNETTFPHKLLFTGRRVSRFVNLSRIFHQLTLSYQRPNYQRWYNQEDFLVGYLVPY